MTVFAAHVKRAIRRLLEKSGYRLVRRVADSGPTLPLLNILIEHCVTQHGRGAVVQIGANDGVMKDPVRDSIRGLGLPALLVEPLPDLFERLKANYADQPGIRFENIAISDNPGEAEIFRISPSATGLPHWVHGIASFDRRVLIKHGSADGVDRARFMDAIESVRVPVLTMRQLLDRHPDVRHIAVLQIDTEGHDLKVLQSAVAAGCLPRLINFEHKHLAYQDQVASRELLVAHGYTFLSGKSDTVAYRTGARSAPAMSGRMALMAECREPCPALLDASRNSDPASPV